MSLKLKRVEINNLRSYRSYAVNIRDGLFNVWGLNGQGKTTLQLAIRLGLGWSPSIRQQETLEDIIHESEDRCRITLHFDNSDGTLKNYPEEVITERYLIRGEARPRMKMTSTNDELVPTTQLIIRDLFSKLGYDPDDSGIFIEQGNLRSFYGISSAALLDKCIGLAGLRIVKENVEKAERDFKNIEDVKKETYQQCAQMEKDLEGYEFGYKAYNDFCTNDNQLKEIELENKAIKYHIKKCESLSAQYNMEDFKEKLDESKRELQIKKDVVKRSQEKIESLNSLLSNLETKKDSIKDTFKELSDKENANEIRKKELESLISRLEDPTIPSLEEAKDNLIRIKESLASLYAEKEITKQKLDDLRSKLADLEKGISSGSAPENMKRLQNLLRTKGIYVEFLADCLEIKSGAEVFRDKIEVLLDPFKFHLVVLKKDLGNLMEILANETDVDVIVPDDWPLNNSVSQSLNEYLILKECAPKNLGNFLSYFSLIGYGIYGPDAGVFLETSLRFQRVYLTLYPRNNTFAIGEISRRIAKELAEKEKTSLETKFERLSVDVNELDSESEKAKEYLDLAEERPNISIHKIELHSVQENIPLLNEEFNHLVDQIENITSDIGKFNQQKIDENTRISEQAVDQAEERVNNYEGHYNRSKQEFEELEYGCKLIERDCIPECIDKFSGFNEGRLKKELSNNEKKKKEIDLSIKALESKITREQAEIDFRSYETLKSLISDKKQASNKHQLQSNTLKVVWDEAKDAYKSVVKKLFTHANLIFSGLYKGQNEDFDGLIDANFNLSPPELEVRIKIGKRRGLLPINSRIGGPSGGEKLGAVVNLIVAILESRSQLAKTDPFLYSPQPFICIDEPQQDMDDPAFGNAILNFKKITKDTQIIILTHNPLSDPEIWQLWLFCDSEAGTVGMAHRGEFQKLLR
jgi:chromosome segregation ATPase